MDPPTVNANPTVLEKSSLHHKRHALEWPELAAIDAGGDPEFPNDNEDVILSGRYRARPQRSPEDVAIANSLSDASIMTHGKATSLLRNLGLNYPMDESQRQQISTSLTFVAPDLDSQWLDDFVKESSQQSNTPNEEKEETIEPDPIDAAEIYDIIRNIQDPEHPLSLEQLGVVSKEQITIDHQGPFSKVDVRFTPTIPHCSMATQIGLCLVVKLNRSLPRFKTTVRIEPGTHASEKAINKQLADKERVSAALENKHLLAIVNKCIINGMTGEMTA